MGNEMTKAAYDKNSEQGLNALKVFLEEETQKPMEMTTVFLSSDFPPENMQP